MDLEVTVIGAGVVGLAIGAEVSRKHDVAILEKNDDFGYETSSRNSEVIHNNIYYPTGSLRGRLCGEGRDLIYSIQDDLLMKVKKIGKLIVATDESEIPKLMQIYQNALNNGVKNLEILDCDAIKQKEPNIIAAKALHSPDTGIMDVRGLMSYYMRNFRSNGGMFVPKTKVVNIEKVIGGYEITQEDSEKFTSKKIINSAGLGSDKIAEMVGFDVDKLGYKLRFCKGEYFGITGHTGKVSRLIYPVPVKDGLGIHLTIDLGGQMKLGPNVVEMKCRYDDLNYSVDESHQHEFYKSAKRFLPFLEEKNLSTLWSGIRPKRVSGSEFIIKEETDNGYPGFINLIGIESPGLTASFAIAKYVARLL